MTLIAAQPILGVRDRTGRDIDPPQRAWERLDELEQRVRELEEELQRRRDEPPT